MSNEDLNLDDIPGLGPVRRAALAEAGIHDLQGLLRLKVAELAAIRGVGHWQARKIAEFLRQRGLVLEVEVSGGEPAVVIVAPESPDERAAVAQALETLETQAAIEAQLEAEVASLEEAVTARGDGEKADDLTDEETALVEASTATPEQYEQTVREVLARAAQPEAASTLKGVDSQNGSGTPPSSATNAETSVNGEKSQVKEAQEPAEAVEPSAAEDQPEAQAQPEAGAAEPAEEGGDDSYERIRSQREQLPEAALELMEAIRAAAVSNQLTRQITRLLILAGEFINDSRPISEKQRKVASEALDQAEQSLRRAIEKRAFSPREQKELASRIRRRRKQLEQVLERE